MIRSLAVISLCAVALAQPALSAPYKDPSGRFDMTIPDGWTNVETKDVKEIGFVIGRENSAELPNGAACIGLFLETPDTRGRTQEELNNLFGEELTPDFWNKATKSTGKDEMTVLSTGTREQTGRKISYFVFTGTADDQGTKVQGKGKTEIHFVPGSVHFVMCVTNVANYDAMIAEFDAIFTSYVPRGGSSVVAGLERPAPSMLTMFAGPNFNGAARVLSKGKTMTFGVRPRAFSLAGAASAHTLSGQVELVEPMGAETLFHVRSGGLDIRVVVPRTQRIKVGETLHMRPDPTQTHVFGDDGKAVRS